MRGLRGAPEVRKVVEMIVSARARGVRTDPARADVVKHWYTAWERRYFDLGLYKCDVDVSAVATHQQQVAARRAAAHARLGVLMYEVLIETM